MGKYQIQIQFANRKYKMSLTSSGDLGLGNDTLLPSKLHRHNFMSLSALSLVLHKFISIKFVSLFIANKTLSPRDI